MEMVSPHLMEREPHYDWQALLGFEAPHNQCRPLTAHYSPRSGYTKWKKSAGLKGWHDCHSKTVAGGFSRGWRGRHWVEYWETNETAADLLFPVSPALMAELDARDIPTVSFARLFSLTLCTVSPKERKMDLKWITLHVPPCCVCFHYVLQAICFIWGIAFRRKITSPGNWWSWGRYQRIT